SIMNVNQISETQERYTTGLHSETLVAIDLRKRLNTRREEILAQERNKQIEAQAAAQRRAEAALEAERVALAAENVGLTSSSFFTDGLVNESLMLNIYQGEFSKINLDRDDM